MIVYDFRVASYDHSNQAILYSIFAKVALGTFHGIAQTIPGGGIISGLSQIIHHDEGKCDKESRPIDMWYIRTFLTVLFPPLGVLMAKGFSGFRYVLISCLLTALFYFPGLIYSFAVINESRHGQLETAERKSAEKKYEDIKKSNT
jgi:uncharacterized membrane protein YqaE (UPF0057 family)